jgi:hypothetical protein
MTRIEKLIVRFVDVGRVFVMVGVVGRFGMEGRVWLRVWRRSDVVECMMFLF